MSISGIFGILFHILIAVRQLNNALPNQTYASVFEAYFKKDWICLVGSLLSVSFVMFIIAPYLHAHADTPDKTGDAEDWFVYYVVKYTRIAFAIVGYFGDSLIFGLFGTIGKKLADKGIPTDQPKP